jgi:ATP-dependent Clp protease adaptor protein ClpS
MTQSILKQKTNTTIKKPPMYKVIVLNDDFTPMDFVIDMLMIVFKHSESSAKDLTVTIHNENSAVVGVYNYEIAEQKTIDATIMARDNGHPLLIKLETA